MVGFAIDPAGTQDVPRWGGLSWVVGTEDEFCAQSPLPDECNPDPSPPPSPPNPPPRPPPPPPPGEAGNVLCCLPTALDAVGASAVSNLPTMPLLPPLADDHACFCISDAWHSCTADRCLLALLPP